MHYLEHESVNIEGIRIFGSPYQPSMFDCAFGREKEELQKLWSDADIRADILVTHCPPFGVLDEYKGTKTGCQLLLEKVNHLRPKYHIFGHNRDCYGVVTAEPTTFVNCCRFDAKFKPVNPPVVLEYARE